MSSNQQLDEWTVKKIPQAGNMQADALAGIAASLPISESILLPICIQTAPSIIESPVCRTIKENQEWTNSIKTYLRTSALPEDSKHAHRTRVQVAHFTLIRDYLYRRSFGDPYLRCLDQSEAQYVLTKLHKGVCGNYSEGWYLVHHTHSQGYYWPTMKQDAEAYVKKCDKCQRYAPIPHMPFETLNSVISP